MIHAWNCRENQLAVGIYWTLIAISCDMSFLLEASVSGDALTISETEYHRAVGEGNVDPALKLEYANNLTRSHHRADILKGLKLLEELFFSTNDVSTHDCLLHLSIGYGRVGDYTLALKYIRLLIMVEPSNREARELETELRRRLRRDGLTGVGFMAGVSVVVALLAVASYYIYSRRNK